MFTEISIFVYIMVEGFVRYSLFLFLIPHVSPVPAFQYKCPITYWKLNLFYHLSNCVRKSIKILDKSLKYFRILCLFIFGLTKYVHLVTTNMYKRNIIYRPFYQHIQMVCKYAYHLNKGCYYNLTVCQRFAWRSNN